MGNTDLKARKCRGCNNTIVYICKFDGFIPLYCHECHAYYEKVMDEFGEWKP